MNRKRFAVVWMDKKFGLFVGLTVITLIATGAFGAGFEDVASRSRWPWYVILALCGLSVLSCVLGLVSLTLRDFYRWKCKRSSPDFDKWNDFYFCGLILKASLKALAEEYLTKLYEKPLQARKSGSQPVTPERTSFQKTSSLLRELLKIQKQLINLWILALMYNSAPAPTLNEFVEAVQKAREEEMGRKAERAVGLGGRIMDRLARER